MRSKRNRRKISKRTRRRMMSRKKGGSFITRLFGVSQPEVKPKPSDDLLALRREVESLKAMITNTNDLKLVLDRVENLKTLQF